MNLLGKIFVVLILVMSIVFMGLALGVYGTHKNWRTVVLGPGGLNQQLNEEKIKSRNLQDQYDKLQKKVQTEDQDLRTQMAAISTNHAQLQKVYDELVREQTGLKEGERRAVEAARVAEALADAKLKENDQLRIDIAKAHDERDTAFKETVAVTDKLHEAQGELTRLTASTQMLTRQVAQYRDRAEKQGVDINAPADNIPPKLDGVVLAVRANKLVEISLGSDDGLRKGHQAYIYRQKAGVSKPVAKIEVVEVTPDKSVGKVIPEFRLGAIERDDRVATRFN
jgi:hypothetical protein